jgi:hypothetical protein
MAVVAPRLAIDLSGNVIRLIFGSPGGPMRFAEAPAPPGSISDGTVEDAAAVAGVLRQLLARAEVKETRAMIAASDSLASFRVLSFAKDTTEPKIDAYVRAQLPADGSRMGFQRQEMTVNGSERTIYAVAFDRHKIQALATAVRQAGLEPSVAELKSLCVARMAPLPACVVLDLTVDPAEVFLIDRSLPRLWHTFRADPENGEEAYGRVAAGLRTVLGYYKRQPGGMEFGPEVPILVASEEALPPRGRDTVETLIGHPIREMPVPTRVASEIPYGTYIACVGLLMRRR